MLWPWKILIFQFCVTMGLALLFYIIWRLTHRGQKWQDARREIIGKDNGKCRLYDCVLLMWNYGGFGIYNRNRSKQAAQKSTKASKWFSSGQKELKCGVGRFKVICRKRSRFIRIEPTGLQLSRNMAVRIPNPSTAPAPVKPLSFTTLIFAASGSYG